MSQTIVQDSKALKSSSNIFINQKVSPIIPAGNIISLYIDRTKIDSNLTDFPILIHLGVQSGITDVNTRSIFTEVGAASGKISIQLPNRTELDVEVESWDSSAQEAYLWVKVPTVYSTSDTELKLYYGANREISTKVYDRASTGARNVWSNNFHSVYHCDELTDTRYNSASSFIGTPYNATSMYDASGIAAAGLISDGTDERIDLSCAPDMSTGCVFRGPLYVSSWFKSTQAGADYDRPFQGLNDYSYTALKYTTFSAQFARFVAYNSGNAMIYQQMRGYGATDNGNAAARSAIGQLNDGNWHQYVFVKDNVAGSAGTYYMYLDGQIGLPITSGVMKAPSGSISAGAADMRSFNGILFLVGVKGGLSFPGSIDEHRIGLMAPNSSWIKADYNSVKDNLVIFNI